MSHMGGSMILLNEKYVDIVSKRYEFGKVSGLDVGIS